MRKTTIALSLLLVATACGPEPSASPEPPPLTEQYGCGFGFYLGSSDETAGLFVHFEDFEAAQAGQVPPSSELAGEAWRAQLQFGSDLFANWCDDVLEPDESTPEIDETWDVTGTIDIIDLADPGGCGPATARLGDVEARSPDGEVATLGDFDVVNEFWGCFAG